MRPDLEQIAEYIEYMENPGSRISKKQGKEITAALMIALSDKNYLAQEMVTGRIEVPVISHKRVYLVDFRVAPQGANIKVNGWITLN